MKYRVTTDFISLESGMYEKGQTLEDLTPEQVKDFGDFIREVRQYKKKDVDTTEET